MMPGTSSLLRSQIVQTFIVAYKEDTRLLEQVLAEEGLPAEVLRPSYTEQELTYSRNVRCLLNHASAWQRACTASGMTLVVEADFVPCVGFGHMPLPFDPQRQGDVAWAFLYTGGPRIFRLFPDGGMQGHSASVAAYVITSRVAGWLTEYTQEELKRHKDLTQYSLWDTQFQWHIMGRGAICFMPYRNYGEHGGLPNLEHRRAGLGMAARHPLLAWLGLGRNHHADVLYGPLKFMPLYANGSRWRYICTRIEAKITGLLKLLCGRMVMASIYPLSKSEKLRLYWICLKRLCSPY